MKPVGGITVPVTVTIDFAGDGATMGRLVNRCLAAEALAESRKARLDAASALCDRWEAAHGRQWVLARELRAAIGGAS